jgi:hypothetical protein
VSQLFNVINTQLIVHFVSLKQRRGGELVCLMYLIGHGLEDPGFRVLFSDTSVPVKWPTQPPIQRVPPVLVPQIMQQGSEVSTRLHKSEAIPVRPLYTFMVCRGTILPLLIRK